MARFFFYVGLVLATVSTIGSAATGDFALMSFALFAVIMSLFFLGISRLNK